MNGRLLTMTPRNAFQADAQLMKKHAEAVASPLIQASVDTALLEFVRQLNILNREDPASRYLRLQGAQEFIHIWATLSQLQTSPQTPTEFNLSHGN